MNCTGGAFARSRLVPWLGHELYKPEGPQVWVLLYTSDICRDALAEGKRPTLEVLIEISSQAQKWLPTMPTLGMSKLHVWSFWSRVFCRCRSHVGHPTATRLLGSRRPATCHGNPGGMSSRSRFDSRTRTGQARIRLGFRRALSFDSGLWGFNSTRRGITGIPPRLKLLHQANMLT